MVSEGWGGREGGREEKLAYERIRVVIYFDCLPANEHETAKWKELLQL